MVSRLCTYVVSVLLAPALLLQACVSAVTEQPQPEPVKLKVLLLPFLSYAPLFIADEEGYFAEQRLEIEFVRMSKSAEAIPALAQGDLDVATGILTINTLSAMSKGTNIKFVAGRGYMDPTGCTYFALMARQSLVENGELDNLNQMQGRRIAMRKASIYEYFMEKLLSPSDLTVADIKIVDLSWPTMAESFGSGALDLGFTPEPWVTRILETGNGDIWVPIEQLVPDFQHAFIIYGPSLLHGDPDIGRRFMVAYFKALQQYNQGKTSRNIDIIAERTGLDRELLNQSCWPSFRQDGTINVQGVLNFQSWAVEKGYLDSELSEDRFWDSSFIEYANQVLNTPDQ